MKSQMASFVMNAVTLALWSWTSAQLWSKTLQVTKLRMKMRRLRQPIKLNTIFNRHSRHSQNSWVREIRSLASWRRSMREALRLLR
jgi:hypothetical protein